MLSPSESSLELIPGREYRVSLVSYYSKNIIEEGNQEEEGLIYVLRAIINIPPLMIFVSFFNFIFEPYFVDVLHISDGPIFGFFKVSLSVLGHFVDFVISIVIDAKHVINHS